MSLKILKIHPAQIYLADLVKEHPRKNLSYAECMAWYNSENILLPGDMTPALKEQGFDVFDVLYPDSFSMMTWAAENSLRHLISPHGHQGILMQMIRTFQPDVILIYAGALFHIDKIRRNLIRSIVPNVKIVGFWADELHATLGSYDHYFGDLDFVLTGSEQYSSKFRQAGIACEKFGSSFAQIDYKPAPARDIDVLFCGTTGYLVPEHTTRYHILNRLVDDFPQLRIYSKMPKGVPLSPRARLLSKLVQTTPLYAFRFFHKLARLLKHRRISANLERVITIKTNYLNPDFLLLRHGNPNIYVFNSAPKPDKLFKRVSRYQPNFQSGAFWHIKGSDYYHLLSRAKIVINIARDEAADVGNIRCFEATGLGALLITDNRPGMDALFEEGKEAVFYKTYDDLKIKINHYLAHENEREAIAAAGQARTLKDHTVRAKMTVLAGVLNGVSLPSDIKRTKILHGIYNANDNPISFDIVFFLEALKIQRKLGGYEKVIAQIIPPYDLQNQPGLPEDAQNVFNQTDELRFRIDHILAQVLQTEKDLDIVINRDAKNYIRLSGPGVKIDRYPAHPSHHAEYYKVVNGNPQLVTGPSASMKAQDVVKNWLDGRSIRADNLYTITIRNYNVFPERNSNVPAWVETANELKSRGFDVIVVPDLSNIAKMEKDFLGAAIFELGALDFDLRLALYEMARMNLFVNNGPCAAAALSPKISYKMFNIMVDNSVTTEAKFLEMKGYTVGQNPPYARGNQTWVWKSDSFKNIMHEIDAFESKEKRTAA